MAGCTLLTLCCAQLIFLLWTHPSNANPMATSTPAAENQCTCTFDPPPFVVCTSFDAESIAAITTAQQDITAEIGRLKPEVENYGTELRLADDRIKEFDTQLSELVASCLLARSTPQDGVAGAENTMEELRSQFLSLEEILNTVMENQPDNTVLLGLESQMENITIAMETIATDVVDMRNSDWRTQATTIQGELDECLENPTQIQSSVTQWPRRGTQDLDDKTLTGILQPFTVRGESTVFPKQLWFSDPTYEPSAIWSGMYTSEVCTTNPYDCRYGSFVEERTTIQRFNNSKLFENSYRLGFTTYYLPHRVENDPGSIIARDGFLYYFKQQVEANSHVIVKFDYKLNTTIVERDLADVKIRNNPYTQYISSIDLEIDESGLWMIYSTDENQGSIVLSKINTATLEVEETWNGNFPKSSLGNCFVTSGVLYCINTHRSHDARVNYYLDTNRNDEGFMNVPFDSKYLNLRSLKYNPYYQKLFAIDDGLAVVYDLIFE